jgi:hypothetical protein
MFEVTIGAGISVLTTLMLFPSRAGPAFAEHIGRTLPMLFDVMGGALASALGKPRDQDSITKSGAKIRAAFAAGDVLAKETRLEVAGFLVDHPDPDAVLRALRRFWHTDIMLLRAVAAPLLSCDRIWRSLWQPSTPCERDIRKPTAPRLRLTSPPSWMRCQRSNSTSVRCASGASCARCRSMKCSGS